MFLTGETVAVKVRHPNVMRRIQDDFRILGAISSFLCQFSFFRNLNLEETVKQFSHTMTAQTDLRVEANHLQRFYHNFSIVESSVLAPRLVEDLVTSGVIVETFEPGEPLTEYLTNPRPINREIAALGVDTYLKMVLTDNFVHADLHPGNLLARTVPCSTSSSRSSSTSSSRSSSRSTEVKAQLVMLDFGLAQELSPQERQHFISFIMNIGSGDGVSAARHVLAWGEDQRCIDKASFIKEMDQLFKRECDIAKVDIDADTVLREVFGLARKYHVTIDCSYAALAISVAVISGFSKSLDPNLCILHASIPCFAAYNLTGKVST